MVAGELSDVESEEEGILQTGKRKRASIPTEQRTDPLDAGSSRPKKRDELLKNWPLIGE